MSMEYIVTINGADKNQLKWRLNDDNVIQYAFQNVNDDWTDFESGGGTVNAWGDISGTLANQTDLQDALNLKVDKITGKGLSTVDFTLAYETKLNSIATGATANSTDSYLLNRANHTGTQEISTINNLQLTITNLQNNIGDLGTAITQVNNSVALKANSASPTFTGTVVLPTTTSIGNVSNVELSYVDGVTSPLQTQLDGKLAIAGGTMTGAVILQYGIRIGGTGNTDGNTFIGRNAFISRTSGTNNTGIGASTLGSVTSGTGNTAFGNGAGGTITTGGGNIIIGNNITGITTGSNNILIGSNSETVTTGSNNINIGGRIIVNSSGVFQLKSYTTAGILRISATGVVTSDTTTFASLSATQDWTGINTFVNTGANQNINIRSGNSNTATINLGSVATPNNLVIAVDNSTNVASFLNNGLGFRLFNNGNLNVGGVVDTGDKVNVNGSIRVSGDGIFNANVGIGGTPNSAYKLDLIGVGAVSQRIYSSNNVSQLVLDGTTGQIYNAVGEFYITNGGIGSTRFVTNGAEQMIILPNGNIGIGVGSANEKLQVAGNIRLGVSGTGYLSGAFTLESSWKHLIFGTTRFDGINYITPSVGSNSVAVISTDLQGIGFYANPSSGSDGIVTNPSTFESYLRMRIKSNGNVGIGTNDPEQKLQVDGLIKLKTYTTAEINAIVGMTKGTIVMNGTLDTLCFYNGSSWRQLSHTAM